MKVAIQGISGSFHEQAAKDFFPAHDYETIECATFRAVFDAVNNDRAEYGIVAVENSLHGPINPVYRLLASQSLWVCGEIRLQIELHLIMYGSGQTFGDVKDSITEVLSHQAALSQCEEWLNKNLPDAKRTESQDTAGAVQYLIQEKSEYLAAIANKQAAELHGGTIVAGPINDDPENYTRFFVLSKEKAALPNANRTSLILTEKDDDEPGRLYAALGIFNENKINLSKLDSHPLPGRKRRYAFYVDFDQAVTTDAAKIALKKIEKLGWNITILGSYKAFKH